MTSAEDKNLNLVWIDLEMTGLDPSVDTIIEIATVVTDSQLDVIAQGPVLAIHQSKETMDAMDEWNTRTHGATGLTERVLASELSLDDAQAQTLAFLAQYTNKGKSPLCGNSICQDRRFIYKYMPALSDWLHYRNVDVSSIKELVKRWDSKVLAGFTKRGTHKALDDIMESIEELKFYRSNVMSI